MSHSSKQVAEGFYGTLDFAVMEAARITEEGHLVLSSGVGNNVEHLDHASHIIVEVNNWQSPDLEGIADVGVEVHHDAMVVITECGYADLRGLAPRHRAPKMRSIAHPDYRPAARGVRGAGQRGGRCDARPPRRRDGLRVPHEPG